MAYGTRRAEIANGIARATVHQVKSWLFPGMTDDEIHTTTGIPKTIFQNTVWGEIIEICEKSKLDLGIILRDVAGNEVEIWPRENFLTQNRGKAFEGLPATETSNGQVAAADGEYVL